MSKTEVVVKKNVAVFLTQQKAIYDHQDKRISSKLDLDESKFNCFKALRNNPELSQVVTAELHQHEGNLTMHLSQALQACLLIILEKLELCHNMVFRLGQGVNVSSTERGRKTENFEPLFNDFPTGQERITVHPK